MRTVIFPGRYDSLAKIADFIRQAAKDAGLDNLAVYAVETAVDEACSNIIEHAYKGSPKGILDISCDAAGGELTVIVHDHGKEFDMSRVRKPNLSKQLSEREVGGLGVYLMHQLMDEVHFSSSKRFGNTLTMIKRKSRDS